MDNRNFVLALALSMLLFVGWGFGMNYLYPPVETPEAATPTTAAATAEGSTNAATSAPTMPGATMPAGAPAGIAAANQAPVELESALSDTSRITIDSPRVIGSINPVGARIDDIQLKDHRQTIEKDSGPVRIFAPALTDEQYYAKFSFYVDGTEVPETAVWQTDGETLAPGSPVTLRRTDEKGIAYSITYSIDDDYMITARQQAENTTQNAVLVQPFVFIDRTSTTATPDQFIAHSGPVGVFDETLQDPHSYEELAELGEWLPGGSTSWLGFTDSYWLSALVPGEGSVAAAGFQSLGNNLFRSGVTYQAQAIPAGGVISQETRLFAGAKESVVLDQYEDTGIINFGKAISWGWFEWFEKPLLWLLRTLHDFVGNFGLAIILLTVIIRGALFPIAQKQFGSMAQMKAVQPKMKAIQQKHKDDKQKQQQEIMKLYKDEGVNPLAGCLPLIIQIPIFFALYKVLILAIEMRHEPFILWIRDLSAPDPAKILNLFGLLPYDPPSFLGIGILAVLLGVTMWLTFKLNPSAMDPMQQQIFNIMPWILMFVMAPFAAGLLLYWVTSNLLTLAQQSYLYSKHPQLKAAAQKEKEERERQKAADEAAKAKE